MRLTADCSTALRHAAAVFMFVSCFGIVLPAHADPGAAAVPVISKTTLAEAREMWAASGATSVSEGNLAIGGGNRVDGMSTVGLDKVLLVTVAGVDFEGQSVARYAFVDEILYAISVQLGENLGKTKSPFKVLSKEELAQLEESLTRKYGKPRGLKDLMAGKKPNILIWDMRENELTLTMSIMSGYQLALRNKALVKKVDAYAKAECKKHRQKGDTPTLVTSICL